jgi:tetratricopeptide (TPR) repeat protein
MPKFAICIFLITGLILAGGAGGYLWYCRTSPEPPAVADEQLEPAVRAAIAEARSAVQQSPRRAATWGRLGMVLLAHGFPAEAEGCFVRAEQLDPREPRWPYYLGAVRSLNDTETAIPPWQRAVELLGDEADGPRLRLARALQEQGHADQARSHYQHLLERRPSHAAAHLGLARLAYEEGNWSDILAHLEHCAASLSCRKAAHTMLVEVYQRLGDQKAVDQELRLLATLPEDQAWPNPYSEELTRLRVDQRSRLKQATRLLDQNRLDEAIAGLRRLVREFPDMDAAWRALGFALFEQGDEVGAAKALQKALQLAPDSAEAQYYMGCVELNQRKPVMAAAYFRRATELKPDYALAHYNLGQCLKLQGDRADAIAAFRTAVDCRPYLAEAHRNLGELLAQEGRKAEALDQLRQAVALNPADAEARKLLQQLEVATTPPDKLKPKGG